MKTSCGVIITDGKKLLAVVPWGKPSSRDIPKGELDDTDEYAVSCAVRELREETGIVLRASALQPLGVFNYTTEKKLQLFLHRVSRLPDISKCRCTSLMSNPIHKGLKPVPEVVGYELIEFSDPRFYKSLKPVLQQIQNML